MFFQKNLKTHISLNKYSVQKEQGYDLTLVNLDDELITSRIDAKKIKWNSDEKKWSLKNYSIRYFDGLGIEHDIYIGDQDTLVNLGFLPKDIYQQARKTR